MGEIIGGILGGIGSVGGALIQADAAEKARKQALTGYNYLTEGPGKTANNAFIDYGTRGVRDADAARAAQMELLGLSPSGGPMLDMTQGPDGTYRTPPMTGGDMPRQLPGPATSTGGTPMAPDQTNPIRNYWNGAPPGTGGPMAPPVIRGPGGFATIQPVSNDDGVTISGLTATGPNGVTIPPVSPTGTGGAMVPAAGGPTGSNAFNNYLDSTGYKFQLGQGQAAVTTNNAARGLLRSGATAKALTKYGQDLASTTFNNYLTQLGNVGTSGQNAGTLGQNQLGLVTNAGTGAGSSAAGYITEGGNAWAQGLSGTLGNVGNIIANLPGTGGQMQRKAA